MSAPNLPLRQLLTPGFRPSDALCGKLPHSLRVVLAGDSYTYGHGVARHEALPSQLQAELNRGSGLPFCEVVNLGWPGLNVYGELEVLRHLTGRLEFDLLVLCLSSDDASPLPRLLLERGGREQKERWRLQWHPDGQDFPHLLRALGTIAADQRLAGRPLVVTFYEPVTGTSELPLAVLPAVCETLEVPFLDLFSPFQRFSVEQLVVSEADSHPSLLAHRIAAVELAEVVRPLLAALAPPRREEDTGQAELAARLERLRGPEAEQGCAGRLVWSHLAELQSPAATGSPAAAELRGLVNRRAREALLRELLVAVQPEVAALGEQLFDLRRQFLLAQLEVAGMPEEVADWEEPGEAMLAAGARLRQALEQPLPPPVAATPAPADPAAEVIRGCAARLADEVAAEAARNRGACGGLLEVLAEVRLTAARGRSRGKVSERSVSLARGIARSLERLAALLAPGLEEGLEARAEIVAEVDLPEEPEVFHVDLVGDCTVLFPYPQVHRQVHYAVRNGRRHAYRLDLPPGVVARMDLQLRRYHADGRIEMSPCEQEVQGLWVAQAAQRRAYRLGEPVLAPWPPCP